MTKKDVIDYKKLEANLQPDADVLTSVFTLFDLCGVKLPTGETKADTTAKRKKIFSDFVKYSFFENNKVALDMPFGFMFSQFANGCVDGTYKREGNNISAFVQCLNENISEINYEWKRSKRKDQKQLQAPKGTKFEQEGDETIKRMYDIIQQIDGSGMKNISLFKNSGNSFDRIKSEYKRRGLDRK